MLKKIQNIIIHKINNLGYILWGIEIENKKIIIFIDNIQKNITINDCEYVSNIINPILVLHGYDYILEISSPGLNRKIFTFKQLILYKHALFYIKLKNPIRVYDKNNDTFNGNIIEIKHNEIFQFKIKNTNMIINLNFKNIDIIHIM